MAKRRHVEISSRYPDSRARAIADTVVDGMDLSATMLEYIAAWEDAYVSAGGRVALR